MKKHLLLLLGVTIAAMASFATEAAACALCGDGGQGTTSGTDAIIPLAIVGGGAFLLFGARLFGTRGKNNPKPW